MSRNKNRRCKCEIRCWCLRRSGGVRTGTITGNHSGDLGFRLGTAPTQERLDNKYNMVTYSP